MRRLVSGIVNRLDRVDRWKRNPLNAFCLWLRDRSATFDLLLNACGPKMISELMPRAHRKRQQHRQRQGANRTFENRRDDAQSRSKPWDHLIAMLSPRLVTLKRVAV